MKLVIAATPNVAIPTIRSRADARGCFKAWHLVDLGFYAIATCKIDAPTNTSRELISDCCYFRASISVVRLKNLKEPHVKQLLF